MFLPTRCPLCGAIGAAPCASCARSLTRAGLVAPVVGCASVAACYRYDQSARAVVLALKFRNRRDSVAFCAAAIAELAPAVDLVTWAPSTPQRVRARGFDQAEVLARAAARRLGLPARATLRRVGVTPQTGLGAAARRLGPGFVARAGRVHGARVLVVDDIVTTGSTFAHAARALRAAGATEVHARALAWTPPKAVSRPPADPPPKRRTSAPDTVVRRVAS